MSVQSIKNTEMSRPRRCSVGGALAVGLLAGNAVHDVLPLGQNSIPYKQIRNLVEYSYSNSYNMLSKDIKEKSIRSLAQDTFVHLVESGNVHDNYKKAVKSLENNSEALEEFKELIWLANNESSAAARKLLNNHIKTLKHSRATLPFLVGGAIVCLIGAAIYNYTNFVKSIES